MRNYSKMMYVLRETSIGHFARGSILAAAEFNHGDIPQTWVVFFGARRNKTFLSNSIIGKEKFFHVLNQCCAHLSYYVSGAIIHGERPNGRIHKLDGCRRRVVTHPQRSQRRESCVTTCLKERCSKTLINQTILLKLSGHY